MPHCSSEQKYAQCVPTEKTSGADTDFPQIFVTAARTSENLKQAGLQENALDFERGDDKNLQRRLRRAAYRHRLAVALSV